MHLLFSTFGEVKVEEILTNIKSTFCVSNNLSKMWYIELKVEVTVETNY